MKILLIVVTLINIALASSPNKNILSSNYKGQRLVITENEKVLTFKGEGIQGSIPILKCSEANRKQFFRKLEHLSKKSISLKDANSLDVEVLGTRKIVLPSSPLGKFLQNFTQHLLTLKNETAIACKK